MEQIVDHVEQKLFGSLESEVSSKVISELVMEQLYVRLMRSRMCGFASIYRQFKDINTFMEKSPDTLFFKDKQFGGYGAGCTRFSLSKGRWIYGRTAQKQLNFILEIDKEKNIFRQTHLSGHGRREATPTRMAHGCHGVLLQEYSGSGCGARHAHACARCGGD